MQLQTPANSQFEIPTLMKIPPLLPLSSIPFKAPSPSPPASICSTNQLINSIAVFNLTLKNNPLVLTGVASYRAVINSANYVWTPHLSDMCLTHSQPSKTLTTSIAIQSKRMKVHTHIHTYYVVSSIRYKRNSFAKMC